MIDREIETLEYNCESFFKENCKLKRELKEKNKQITDLEKQINELKEQIEQIIDAKCTSCTTLGGMQIEIDKLKAQNKDLQHRLDVAQGFLDRDMEYNRLLDVINNQDVKIADLEKKVEQAKDIMGDLLFLVITSKIRTINSEEIKDKARQFIKEHSTPFVS